MAVRKATCVLGWRSVHETYYDTNLAGTPTSDGAGTCTFDFGVDKIITNFINAPDATGMTHGLFAFKTLLVTDNASWTDGTTRRMFAFAGFLIFAKKSGSNWVLYTTRNDGTTLIQESTVTRSFATNYTISVSRQHASPYRCRIWIDGTLDIDGNSNATAATAGNITLGTDSDTANGSMTIGVGYVTFTDTDEHIDASTVTVLEMVASADGVYQEFTTFDEGGSPATAPYYDSVDEDGPDDETTYLQTDAVQSPVTYRCSFDTTNVTLSNVEAVAIFFRVKATVAAKSIDAFSLCGDGTDKEEVSTTGVVATTYTNRRCIHYRAPDAGVWTQTDLDNLEIGVRADVPDTIVALRLTSIHAEAVGADYTANPAAATRRRVGPTLMSPGLF